MGRLPDTTSPHLLISRYLQPSCMHGAMWCNCVTQNVVVCAAQCCVLFFACFGDCLPCPALPCPALPCHTGTDIPHVGDLLQVRQAREAESTAEWIVDITTLADRQGRATEFAGGYSQSQLWQQNEQQLNKCLAHGSGQVMYPIVVFCHSLPTSVCLYRILAVWLQTLSHRRSSLAHGVSFILSG